MIVGMEGLLSFTGCDMGSQSKKSLLGSGTVLNGKWEILRHIGKGGKGEVYLARQVNLDRHVVIKVISREFLESFEGDQEEIQAELERFRREVLIMAQVRHPNVVQVYDYEKAMLPGEGGDAVDYIVMEHIPGPSLRSVMPEEGLGADDKRVADWIKRYFLPILDGLQHIHGLGIVHRDIKPENVLLDGETPKIVDFGLAGGPKWHSVTRSHHVIGTIPYMAGEQFLDMAGTDLRADVYSLGKILYEAISGKMTKETAEPFKTARLRQPSTPFLKRLDEIIQKATSEDREGRIPSVEALRETIVKTMVEFGLLSGVGSGGLGKLRAAAAVILLLATVSVVFHVLYHRQREAYLETQPGPGGVPVPHSAEMKELTSQGGFSSLGTPVTLKGTDGATLHLVPSGRVSFPENYNFQPGMSVRVDAFFLEETQVTNYQYSEFLNRNLQRISVKDGVVRAGGEIWLILGEVMEGYEPIVFQGGRFHITDPAHAACPVLRVTAYGAEAYAAFYGRRLPTEMELLRAGGGIGDQSLLQRESPIAWVRTAQAQSMHEQMHGPSSGAVQPRPPSRQAPLSDQAPSRTAESSPNPPKRSNMPLPVLSFPANSHGIRGLGGDIGEWALRLKEGTSERAAEIDHVVVPRGVQRRAWEAFESVGFRTALSIGDG